MTVMDPTLARYAAADPLFYDMPRAGVDAPTFCAGLGLDWDGWQIDRREPWTYLHPGGLRLPDQGWKVHVSATATTATRVLELAAEFCMAHRLSFKHLTGPRQFAASNSKEADRGSAGKFITVYPEDETRLLDALTGLDALVGGQPGPYILSDLRWRSGPVFVRYGAFARMWTRDERGQLVPALRDPEGRLVEDRRTAGFTPPSWAPMPAFLRKELAALGDSTPPDSFGYKITRVLHYSNAGGVYEATDAGGTRVVLKEGRPHAGVTPDGRDGATRILDEERNLLALAETDVVGVRDAFTLHDHRFLVLEYVDGSGLNTEIVRRNPSIHGTSSATDYRDYARWACGISDQLTSTVRRLHAAGYVHGDLHPRNVVVRPDDGSLQVNEGWRLDPYLASGSVGIGLVAAQLLPHLPDPERYHLALDGIAAAACTPFTIEPGLFYGRAGMIHFLVGLARMGLQTPAMDRALARHVEQLRLHALRHGAGIGFPGRGLMRMSCDLATGSAGVLTALRAHALLAFEPHRAGWNDLLPLLLPAAPSGATDRATETSVGERR